MRFKVRKAIIRGALTRSQARPRASVEWFS
jgi:hypothetical protein